MPDTLPSFRYHRDPVATGSLVAADARCPVCNLVRGYTYVGPTYAIDEVEGLCPWCIADGSAARAYGADFTDIEIGVPAGVAATVLELVSRRTPGFSGWQSEHWTYHCDDACAFLGKVGAEQLASLPDEARTAIAAESRAVDHWSEELLSDVLANLSRDGSPTGYLFQCLHCAAFTGYLDFD
jgi:uncharacterized protein CbrC (UPF0167 family)